MAKAADTSLYGTTESNKVTVKTVSVSYALDLHRGGERSSHFVSANIEFEKPVPIDELPRAQLEAGYKVATAVIHDAVIRGALPVEQANERISDMKEAYEAVKSLGNSEENENNQGASNS